MWLKYWYEDELNILSEIDKKGSKWIYLNSREFEKVFGYKEKPVYLTMESDDKGEDSDTQRARTMRSLDRFNEIWKNLKNIRRIRDVAVPFRIVCE